MYCRNCYVRLDPAAPDRRCPRCNRGFDPDNPATYLRRPFPDKGKIIRYLVITSIITLLVAFVVSFFQMAVASGH
jgi:hypothetical protein